MKRDELKAGEPKTCVVCDQSIEGNFHYYGVTTPRIAASLTAKRRQWQELANGSVRIELCAWCASEINHTLSLTSVPATRPSVLEAY